MELFAKSCIVDVRLGFKHASNWLTLNHLIDARIYYKTAIEKIEDSFHGLISFKAGNQRWDRHYYSQLFSW